VTGDDTILDVESADSPSTAPVRPTIDPRTDRFVERMVRRTAARQPANCLALRLLFVTAAIYALIVGAHFGALLDQHSQVVPRAFVSEACLLASATLLLLAARFVPRSPAWFAIVMLVLATHETNDAIGMWHWHSAAILLALGVGVPLSVYASTRTLLVAGTLRAVATVDRSLSIDDAVRAIREAARAWRRGFIAFAIGLVVFPMLDASFVLSLDPAVTQTLYSAVFSVTLAIVCGGLSWLVGPDLMPTFFPMKAKVLPWVWVPVGLAAVYFLDVGLDHAVFVKLPQPPPTFEDAVDDSLDRLPESPIVLETLTALYFPLAEEFLFRGLLWAALLGLGFSTRAVGWTIALHFTLWHSTLSATVALPNLLFHVSMALFLGELRIRTNSLAPCIVAHAIWNSFAVWFPQLFAKFD
jgi:membrane protease YdiL (CAAX protease family)